MSIIVDQVKQIIADHLGVKKEDVTPNKSFVDDLGCDSLDTVELIMAFEQDFGIIIPDDAAEKMFTVQDAITIVENLQTP